MPPKKKVAPPVELPTNRLTGMFGWCLIPQHELCPAVAPSVDCSCECHKTERKAVEPSTPGTDS